MLEDAYGARAPRFRVYIQDILQIHQILVHTMAAKNSEPDQLIRLPEYHLGSGRQGVGRRGFKLGEFGSFGLEAGIEGTTVQGLELRALEVESFCFPPSPYALQAQDMQAETYILNQARNPKCRSPASRRRSSLLCLDRLCNGRTEQQLGVRWQPGLRIY